MAANNLAAVPRPKLLTDEAGQPARTSRARLVVGILAALLVVAALRLPVWRAHLSAPQYPGGLELVAYGHGVEGDVAEVNQLNHYVGMKAFDASDAPEMVLWPAALAVALVLVVLSSVLGRRLIGRLARLGVWLVPLGTLADVQYRLYQYGQAVSPDAPIRLKPFFPLVVGPTKVMNFTTWAYPGEAVWALLLAAFMVTFGPGLVRRIRRPILWIR